MMVAGSSMRRAATWILPAAGCLLALACGARSGLDLEEQADGGAADEDAASDVRGPLDARADASIPDAGESFDGSDAADAFDAAESLPPIDAQPPDAPTPCPDGGSPVAYLVSTNDDLYTVDPTTATATLVTTLACPAGGASPFTMAISRTGVAYIVYSDFNIYAVDLVSFACTKTAYVQPQLQLVNPIDLAISSGTTESLYYYGKSYAGGGSGADILAASDLSTFVLTEIGPVVPDPGTNVLDIKVDAFGRIFGLSNGGLFVEIDPTSGALIGQNATSFSTAGDWALLTYDGQIYFYGGSGPSTEYVYDLATNNVTTVGTIDDGIVGASAAACVQ
jgi:hypothetical protein